MTARSRACAVTWWPTPTRDGSVRRGSWRMRGSTGRWCGPPPRCPTRAPRRCAGWCCSHTHTVSNGGYERVLTSFAVSFECPDQPETLVLGAVGTSSRAVGPTSPLDADPTAGSTFAHASHLRVRAGGALTLAQALLSEMLASGYGCTKDEEAAANVRPAPPREPSLVFSCLYLREIHELVTSASSLTAPQTPGVARFWLAAVGREGEEGACIPRGCVLHHLSVETKTKALYSLPTLPRVPPVSIDCCSQTLMCAIQPTRI